MEVAILSILTLFFGYRGNPCRSPTYRVSEKDNLFSLKTPERILRLDGMRLKT
jgi:hypothetical protein